MRPPQAVDRIDISGTVVLAAAGFEDRSISLPSLAIGGDSCALGVIRYTDWEPSNREVELVSKYSSCGVTEDQASFFNYDRHIPDSFADALDDWLNRQSKHKILIDISAMSRMCILMCLESARRVNVHVGLFYTEPQMYGPSEAEYVAARTNGMPRPSIQIYSGVDDVVRSKRLSSVALQGEPSVAIMFMSMNDLLTQALLNQLYPTRLLLINGRPPVHSWREEATAWIHSPLLREWPAEDNPCEINRQGIYLPTRVTSTFDYRETVEMLLDLYWQWSPRYRIILAPTGSKLQTVGAFFVRAAHDDIHVEYPTPKGFLPSYTTGVGTSYLIELGIIEQSIDALRALSLRRHLLVREM